MKLISCGGGVSARRPQPRRLISVPSGAHTRTPKQTAQACSQLVAAPEARISTTRRSKVYQQVKLLPDWSTITATECWTK